MKPLNLRSQLLSNLQIEIKTLKLLIGHNHRVKRAWFIAKGLVFETTFGI